MSLFTFSSKQTVEFYDCDPMGVVWHGNYLKFMEKARGEFLKMIDYSYNKIFQEKYVFPIVEERVKYKSSLRLEDKFEVVTSLDEYRNRLVHSFEIRCDERICIIARTVQVALPIGANELSFFMPKGFIGAVEKFLLANNCPTE